MSSAPAERGDSADPGGRVFEAERVGAGRGNCVHVVDGVADGAVPVSTRSQARGGTGDELSGAGDGAGDAVNVALGAKSGGFRGAGGGGTSPAEAPVLGGGGEPQFGAGGRSADVVGSAVSAIMVGADRAKRTWWVLFLVGGFRLGASFWASGWSQGGSPGGFVWGIIRFQGSALVVP